MDYTPEQLRFIARCAQELDPREFVGPLNAHADLLEAHAKLKAHAEWMYLDLKQLVDLFSGYQGLSFVAHRKSLAAYRADFPREEQP